MAALMEAYEKAKAGSYYKQQGKKVVILLAGGDKRTQSKDIKTALSLSENL